MFRGGYYTEPKGPLPLPPKEVWHIRLDGEPRRVTLGGHDFVVADYTFHSLIVTDPASPGTVEPQLATIGGTWDEPFDLPLDPDLLLERTSYACMDEDQYPAGSVFEENTWYFYDHTCTVETPSTSVCHVTTFPGESCTDALAAHSGRVSPKMRFERIAYDAETARRYRVGTLVNQSGADLAVVHQGIAEERDVLYRYFASDSCEIAEGSVGAPGWRRVLTFSAVVRNDGSEPIHLGSPTDASNPWVKANVFEFSQCHQHYHFSHYGDFQYGDLPGTKKAFCLADTDRFHNDERTPLTAIHESCEYQGIGAGWGDEYQLGIPGQWVDITSLPEATTRSLSFLSNPDQFLCEGQPLDAHNHPVADPVAGLGSIAFDPTSFINPANGGVESRMRCAFPPSWAADNLGKASVAISAPGGSFVTDPCTRGQIGPLRNCGFAAQQRLRSCTPGATVTLRCAADEGAQVLRLCEKSAVLGTGVACTVGDAVANTVVDERGTTVRFTCPAVRDAAGTGGYSVYQAPLLPSMEPAAIRCTDW